MTDPSSDPESRPHTGTARGGHPGLPRWVKMSGIIIAILVLALVAVMLIAGGDHGPSRHGGQATKQTDLKATAAALTGHDLADRAAG
jgi:hypothetical protein